MKKNIEAERARAGLSKGALSAKLGVSHKTYARYISGMAIPSPVLIKMAALFGCTVDYLLVEYSENASA